MTEEQSTIRYANVPGHTGYRVGDDGSVWSCWTKVGFGPGRQVIKPTMSGLWKRLKPTRAKSGHLSVMPSAGWMRCPVGVHVMVLTAFIGPCPDGMECCHNDGDPGNNRLGNLRWDTPKGNAADRVKHGTQVCGHLVNGAKLTDDDVRQIRSRYAAGEKTKALADAFTVSVGNVYFIVTRKTWKHVE